MTYEQASRIYQAIEATNNEMRLDLYWAALRYAVIRVEWFLSSQENRREMDARRTSAHNVVVDAINVLVRNLAKEGHDVSWRQEIPDDRKAIGDFAVLLSAHLGILAR
jgi:cation transport regulator ChaB